MSGSTAYSQGSLTHTSPTMTTTWRHCRQEVQETLAWWFGLVPENYPKKAKPEEIMNIGKVFVQRDGNKKKWKKKKSGLSLYVYYLWKVIPVVPASERSRRTVWHKTLTFGLTGLMHNFWLTRGRSRWQRLVFIICPAVFKFIHYYMQIFPLYNIFVEV